jgi:hypothetical protein
MASRSADIVVTICFPQWHLELGTLSLGVLVSQVVVTLKDAGSPAFKIPVLAS